MNQVDNAALANQKAQQAQLEKEQRIRNTSFKELPSKHWEFKLDLLVNDLALLNKELVESDAKNKSLASALRNQAHALLFMRKTASEKGWFTSEEEYQAQLDAYSDSLQGVRALTSDEVVAAYDTVTINATGKTEDGRPISGLMIRNHTFELNFQNFIPDVEAGYIGMKVGEVKQINATFPENYHNRELAGKVFPFELHLVKAKRNLAFEKQMAQATEQARQSLITEFQKLGVTPSNLETMSLGDMQNELARLRQEIESGSNSAPQGEGQNVETTQPIP